MWVDRGKGLPKVYIRKKRAGPCTKILHRLCSDILAKPSNTVAITRYYEGFSPLKEHIRSIQKNRDRLRKEHRTARITHKSPLHSNIPCKDRRFASAPENPSAAGSTGKKQPTQPRPHDNQQPVPPPVRTGVQRGAPSNKLLSFNLVVCRGTQFKSQARFAGSKESGCSFQTRKPTYLIRQNPRSKSLRRPPSPAIHPQRVALHRRFRQPPEAIRFDFHCSITVLLNLLGGWPLRLV